MVADCLELRDWIAEAERRGLVATIDEIAGLPLDQAVALAPLEYAKFLLLRYPNKFPADLSNGAAHDPTDFFTAMSARFTRTEPLSSLDVFDRGRRPSVPSVAGLFSWPGESEHLHARHLIACDSVSRHAESGGSGDGYSRFILLERLSAGNMPNVYNGAAC